MSPVCCSCDGVSDDNNRVPHSQLRTFFSLCSRWAPGGNLPLLSRVGEGRSCFQYRILLACRVEEGMSMANRHLHFDRSRPFQPGGIGAPGWNNLKRDSSCGCTYLDVVVEVVLVEEDMMASSLCCCYCYCYGLSAAGNHQVCRDCYCYCCC